MTQIQSISGFEYQAPNSLDEVLEILDTETRPIKLMAGGTDLILQMKQQLVHPSLVVDIKQIPELNRLDWNEQEGLHIGASVPLRDFLAYTGLPRGFDLLHQACSLIGSTQIRNRGTMGGNISNAAPSADSAPPLLCLDAELEVASRKSRRTIKMEDFFKGPGETALAQNELLVEIEVPTPTAQSAGCYLRHTTRDEMDIAIVGVASFLKLSGQGGQLQSARIALGAVAPTPVRAYDAEDILHGETLTGETIEKAAEQASETADPVSDVRGSADYRREIVKVLVRRTLMKACQELRIKV